MVKALLVFGRIDDKEDDADVPLIRMDRSVKFAQQSLNRMVEFPSSPSTLFPLESFRLAVTVRVVTPTETQLPCRQQRRSALTHSSYSNIWKICWCLSPLLFYAFYLKSDPTDSEFNAGVQASLIQNMLSMRASGKCS